VLTTVCLVCGLLDQTADGGAKGADAAEGVAACGAGLRERAGERSCSLTQQVKIQAALSHATSRYDLFVSLSLSVCLFIATAAASLSAVLALSRLVCRCRCRYPWI
jgi:hypothetical protein